MPATHRFCHKSKTYHAQSAGYANPCGRGFVAAGKSQHSEHGASFLFSDLAIFSDVSIDPLMLPRLPVGAGEARSSRKLRKSNRPGRDTEGYCSTSPCTTCPHALDCTPERCERYWRWYYSGGGE